MARKQTMMPLTGGGNTGRRVVMALGAAALVALVIRDPAGSAQAVRQLAAWAGAALDALAAFGAALAR